MTSAAERLLAEAWTAMGGSTGLLGHVRLLGPAAVLPSRLPLTAMAQATVGAAGLAAAELAATRAGDRAALPGVRVDSRAVAVAFTSERRLRLDGKGRVAWDPLSRFLPALDGWVRLHGNYPHHRARLLAALGVPAAVDGVPAAVARAVAARRALDVEEAVVAVGGVAAAVRSPEEWLSLPQGAAVAAMPLVTLRAETGAPPRTLPPAPSDPLLPAAGLRVLDLTRVIAGPVGTRTLALLGADVLRVDCPRMPDDPSLHLDTGFGKRSALLDLERPADRAAMEGLVAGADVVVTGYRPTALDRYGLSPHDLLRRHPALVVATLCAWGRSTPWGERRGFDSVVQAASGIARVEAGDDPAPGAMPAQGLDHGTGYLLAAAVLRAITRQAIEGGGWHVELSLARTAAWLLGARAGRGPETGHGALDPALWLATTDTPAGRLTHALPPITLDGGPRTWSRAAAPWGTSPPTWL